MHLHVPGSYHRPASKQNQIELLILPEAQPTDWEARRTNMKQIRTDSRESTDDAQPEGASEWPPIQCNGREGVPEEAWGQAEPVCTFAYYRVMRVDLTYMVPSPQTHQERTQTCDRAGLRFLHCKALERALTTGLKRKSILLRRSLGVLE